MKKHIQKYIRTTALFAVVAALGLGFIPVRAAEETNTANTLKVSPVRTDVEINPGESKVLKSTITNLTDAAITVRAVGNDFVAGDERGTPALILGDDEFAPVHSLKRYMSAIPDATIPAKESVTVESTVSIPADAKAGGYFGAIRFAPANTDEGGQVNMSASVASLFLITVPGDFEEKLALTDFDIQQKGKTASFFRTANDLNASLRFKNDGTVQLGPIGKITVKKGDAVVYETEFNNNDPRDMTLPASARRWDVPLENMSGFGKYSVVATFSYGKNNQTIEVAKSFWVIPTVMIIGLIAILILLAIIIIWLIRRRGAGRVQMSGGPAGGSLRRR